MEELRRLEHWLETVTPAFPPDLVSPGSAERLLSIARRAPLPTPYFGFDCSLAGSDPSVDFGFPLQFETLDQHIQSGAPREGPVWDSLAPFLDAWLDDDSTFGEWVPFLFLEFDEEQHAEAKLRPSVFAALDWPLSEESDGPDLPGIAADTLSALQGARVSAEIETRLRSCFGEARSRGFGILHVGAMLGRAGTPVRVSSLVPAAQVWDFLQSVGWKGARGEGERELAQWVHPAAAIQVDFDISGEIGEKLGFTLRPRKGEGWRDLLDSLVVRGLCTESKAAGLLAFEGTSYMDTGEGEPQPLRREITYLKWSYRAGMSTAKGYFSVLPVPPAKGCPHTPTS